MGLRRPSRQIEVFDISLMAVVTKAMGAFLVLFVLVLPYYTSDPDVDTTSGKAHEQLENMRKEIENIARQVGANPADTGALEAAIRRMREALGEADDKIDQLSKEASALSSQLKRAREELANAQTQLASAEALSQRAQIAEAEMEVTANQALRTRRAALVAEAEMEATANQALRTRRAALIAEAELEQQLNQMSQAQRQTLIAKAEGEQDENALLAVARRATFQPKKLLLYQWTTEPNCANISLNVGFINIDDGAMPDGLNLQNLGGVEKGLTKRSDEVIAAFPLGTYVAGQPRHSLSVRALWRSEQLRALTYAYVEHPATLACHIDLTTTIYDLETGTHRDSEQHDLEVPASAKSMLLNGIDISQSSFRISPPTPLDQALWNSKKTDPQRNNTPAQKSP
jgi:hypothetical protein